MTLAEQWDELARRLPASWDEARLLLAIERGEIDRAAALLGPLNPGRRGAALVFAARRGGGPASPESIRRLLRRLDRESLGGRLEIVSTAQAEAAAPLVHETLVEAWDRELAKLPADWSDLLAQAEFRSSDHVDRAALLMSPLNPGRPPDDPTALALRFRCAQRYGYGASAEMVRRCLARCDDEGLRGTVRILWALSDTHPVGTQGPVWYVGGRAS